MVKSKMTGKGEKYIMLQIIMISKKNAPAKGRYDFLRINL